MRASRSVPPASSSRSAAHCAFCSIVAASPASTDGIDGIGGIEDVASSGAHVVWSDAHTVAFLDRSPVFKGHVLVVPRAHIETLPELDDVAPFFLSVQRVARALPGALDAHGTWVAINNVVSQSVPHLHAHVVPRRRRDGLRGFFWPRERYEDDAEAALFARQVRRSLLD
jgi:histidine triad (HIT) family protein